MTIAFAAALHLVTFGCHWHTSGNEKQLHLHFGEAFAGDVSINKNRHCALISILFGLLTVMH